MNEEKVIFIYDETKENIESKILKLFKQFLELENTWVKGWKKYRARYTYI